MTRSNSLIHKNNPNRETHSALWLMVCLTLAFIMIHELAFGQTTLYLQSTQTQPGTGTFEITGTGTNVYDLATAIGTAGTVTSYTDNPDAYTETLAFTIAAGNLPYPMLGNSFPVSVFVSKISVDNLSYRFRLQRVSSGGTVLANSTAYSGEFSTTGIKTATFAFGTTQTWASTDRLRLSFEVMKTGTGLLTKTITVSTGIANSYVQLPSKTPGGTWTETYNYTGSAQTFTVPSCISTVTVQAWGGGGGGGVAYLYASCGGGGGAYTKGILSGLTAGNNITINVGAGGKAESTDGGATTITSGANTITANAGKRPVHSYEAGLGGAAVSTGGIIAASFAGGNGGLGDFFRVDNEFGTYFHHSGGGGGGSAFAGAAGQNGGDGSGSAGGAGGAGTGDGGRGGSDWDYVQTDYRGTPGIVPGGGGGGDGDLGGAGTDGAPGMAIVTYTLPAAPTITLSATTANGCYTANSQTVSLPYSSTTGCPDRFSIDFASGIPDITDSYLYANTISINLPAGLATGTYTGNLKVKNSTYGFESSGTTITVKVNAIPSVAAIGGGATSVCANASTPAFTDATSGGSWSIINGTGSASITAGGVVTGITAGSVTVVYTYSDGTCNNSATKELTINALPTVAAIGGGAASVCVNSTTPAFTNATTGGTWSITKGTGSASITSGGVVTGITAGTVTIVYTYSNGTCSNSATKALTVNALPTATLTGSAVICPGQSTDLSVVLTGTPPWSITYNDATTPVTITGITTSPKLISVSPVSSTAYNLTAVSDNHCNGIATGSITVTVYPEQVAPVASADQSICYGTAPSPLSVTDATGGNGTYSYQWQVFGTDWTNVSGATSQNYAPGALTATTKYRIQASNSCGTVTSNEVTITVNPLPTASISGNNGPICAGNTGEFHLTGPGHSDITYSLNGTVTTQPIRTGVITVPDLKEDATLTLLSVEYMGCIQTFSGVSSTITVNPLPTAAVSGNNSPVCAGSDAEFRLSGTPNAEVTYSTDGGLHTSTVTLDNSGTATVTIANAMADVTLSLHSVRNNSTGCSESLIETSVVIVRPMPWAEITGNNGPVCAGNIGKFYLNCSSGSSITYSINGTITTEYMRIGQDQEIRVPDLMTDVTLTLISITNSRSGCSQTYTGVSSTLTVNPLPTAAVTGNNSLVCTGSDAKFSSQRNTGRRGDLQHGWRTACIDGNTRQFGNG